MHKLHDYFKIGTRVQVGIFYFIVTDTVETEKNYLIGLRQSLPEELQGRLVIKVLTTKTEDLISACEEADIDPQYRQRLIAFDRDRVVNFDKIVEDATSKGIRVGWSNPCIEIWFSAYFGKMPAVQESVACWKGFAEQFEKKTGHNYSKSDHQIYAILNKYGKEADAIKCAECRYQNHLRSGTSMPSKMCPCTTVHWLVDEIRKKAVHQDKNSTH